MLKSVVDRHNLSISGKAKVGSMGDIHLGDGLLGVTIAPDGSYEVQLAHPNIENTNLINTVKALDLANGYIR